MKENANEKMALRAAGLAGCLIVLAALACGCARGPGAESPNAGERIVSLAPSLTEIVWAVGAGSNLVGRTSACDYPPEAVSRVPVIGGFGTPNVDSLARVRATLVLEVDLEDESVGGLMEKLGIRQERVKCSNLDDIPEAILAVGGFVGRPERAGELAGLIKSRVSELRAKAGSRAESADTPRVYVEIWGDPLMTVGRGSFVSELVSLAGGRNIGDEVENEYFSVSPEWVIARDPDVIICLYMSDAGTIGDIVGKRTGWNNVKAVREGRVCGGLNSSLVLRPGPRVLDGIESLRRCME